MIAAEVKYTPPDSDPSGVIAAAILDGLKLGGEHVLKLARDRVPIETGTLERSGMASDDGKDTVAVSFDTPYAVRQHEDLTARHDAGREAKYLETAVADGRQDVAALVAARVRNVTGGGAAA